MARMVQRKSGGVRSPAVAGQFYPGNPDELCRMIESFLRAAGAGMGIRPKAVIAPHAGFVYSGVVAASAYAQLAAEDEVRNTVKRVVLLGPSHFVGFAGLAAPSATAFATPLGEVPVDTDAVEEICSREPQVRVRDDAHAEEHALEVHLPFLQTVLADFKIVPLVVGEAGDDEIAAVLEALWNGAETRIVVSSDLSHYLDYETARVVDAETARAIESLDGSELEEDCACGVGPIRGLLKAARARGMSCRNVNLRNSGDTAGARDRVVGYGAFVFVEKMKL